ncbi:mandelate racemase/muconate lactonizing enzyme family protein [Streptomyces odontomachi]|uniref:mandelate racemase/muconate lactonizing enzyme family protein n=1 Tax=Streptomyces odontomachi TaxID=2944940 RepID=UPI00210D0956|nr:mandelate racemase/muconate lactonizing enzyme family protein [Streptomyces sp. ODS25]
MANVIRASAYLVDIEVETVRTDASQAFLKQETLFVELTTDDGLTGTGYAYTIGTGGRAVLSMLREHLLPSLTGHDSRAIEGAWRTMYDGTRATMVGPITALGLAAVDLALWDLRCLRAGEPLWRVAGGHRPAVPAYDTERGWLQLAEGELVAGALQAREQGFSGVKIKIGKPTAGEDAARIGAVRDAVGPGMEIMVDANQAFTPAEAVRRAARLEPFDVGWFEEPLPADDVAGHERLAASTAIPVAVGESMYSLAHFREYLQRGAAGIVQPDVSRIGGITPWLKVAHLAEAFGVDVCPHFLMEIHVSLTAAVPNGRLVEYIPQLRAVTTRQLTIADGFAHAPREPGLGISWDRDAIDDRRVA